MKKFNSFVTVCVSVMWMFIFIPFGIIAQDFASPEDNPNVDHIPISLLKQSQSNPDVVPLSAVVTIDNFDNFNLGVDFAEGNIAESTVDPAWYFTAYNTNETHHTEDGHSWYQNDPSFGATMRGDPVQAYDSLGNLYYENMYGGGSIQGCRVITSQDNGASWNPSVIAILGGDKNWLAADQTSGPYANYVYTCMTSTSYNSGKFARSTDLGQTWTTTFTTNQQSLPGMMVAVGPDGDIQGGSVYVVANGGGAFNSKYTFFESNDGGATFSQKSSQYFSNTVGNNVNGRNSVSNMRTRPYPFIAADNSYGANRGRLYCVYASNDPPGNGNKPDIWSRSSDDGGSTWSSEVLVNDDANTAQHNQWHPAIWCDKETGRLYIQWMDTRDCPTNDSALIYASYSDDGGVTFVENQQISNKKMKINCNTCGGGGTPRYEGDYNGIVSNPNVSMANWTDFRNGNFMSMTAYFPDFGMAINIIGDTLYTPLDSSAFSVSVPEVKLYDDIVLVSGSIFPIPTAGTISFSFPSGTQITAFPGSLPVNVVLNGEVPVGTYQATFEAKGPNGTPVHRRTAMIKVEVGGGFYVSATADPGSICEGTTSQLDATTVGGTAPFSFAWTPTTGLSDPAIANPVASPTATTTYIVTATDNLSETATDSVVVTVMSAPPSPGLITGAESTCQDSTEIYEVASMPGATSYSWTVPADATIVSGQNSPTITVTWGPTSGVVSIIAGNDCGSSPPSALDVTVYSILPAPGAILGPDAGCTGVETTFSIIQVPDASSYEWTVPADAQIVTGQGTVEVKVIWGSTAGDISVAAENGCGSGPASLRTLAVATVPGPAGDIVGNDTVCVNQTGYEYSIPAITGAISYQWMLPTGAYITDGQGTNEVTLGFDPQATSGDLSVYGLNDCGDGTSSMKSVIVSECLGVNDYTLEAAVKLFPNPVEEILNIQINGSEREILLTISDVTGNTKMTESLSNLPARYTKRIDVSGFADGVYFIRLTSGDRYFVKKFVVLR